jgi:hypothetical protein
VRKKIKKMNVRTGHRGRPGSRTFFREANTYQRKKKGAGATCTVTTEQDSDRYNLEISIEKELKIEHDHIAKTGVRTQTQR